MSAALELDHIPRLPQAEFLYQLAPTLWQRPDVQALWLEGSMGRGNADLYSDVDLYIAVANDSFDNWRKIAVPDLFPGCYLAHMHSNFGEDLFVYHVYLAGGGIYDLHIQPLTRSLPIARRLLLAFRDEAYKAQVIAAQQEEAGEPIFSPQPVDPEAVEKTIISFWMNADKGRKVLYRNQDFTTYAGFYLFRQMLARLLFIEATDTDCGDLTRPSIHGLKAAAAILNPAQRPEVGVLMGGSAINRLELYQTHSMLHKEFARVGRVLAERYQFEYPVALEQAIIQNWLDFRRNIAEK